MEIYVIITKKIHPNIEYNIVEFINHKLELPKKKEKSVVLTNHWLRKKNRSYTSGNCSNGNDCISLRKIIMEGTGQNVIIRVTSKPIPKPRKARPSFAGTKKMKESKTAIF